MKRPRARFIGVTILAIGLLTVVEARASAPAGRYVIANGMVYDIKTNLTWQQVISKGMYTQGESVSHCATLGLNGVTWRLPTMREILTIVDPSVAPPGPTIDATAFPNTPVGFYWSATQYSGTPENYWSAQFQFGFAYGNRLTDTSYVRCVSSGRAAGLAK